MTTVIVEGTRVYADTASYMNNIRIASLSKIRSINPPLPAHVNIQDEEVSIQFEDVFYGYVIVHAEAPAEAFMKGLGRIAAIDNGDVESCIVTMAMAHNLALSNMQNAFEMVVIGEKSNHLFRFYPETGFEYIPAPREAEDGAPNVIYGGAGGAIAQETYAIRQDALAAMYTSFLHIETSGGMIDVWELLTLDNGEKVFMRIGMGQDLSRTQIRYSLQKCAEVNGCVRLSFPLSAESGQMVKPSTGETTSVIAALEKHEAVVAKVRTKRRTKSTTPLTDKLHRE